MILPIGHESQSVRRLPLVTIGIIAACIIIHIFVSSKMNSLMPEILKDVRDIQEYFLTHPNLKLDPMFNVPSYKGPGEDKYADNYYTEEEDVEERNLQEEQEELNALTERLKTRIRESPFLKWGYVPKNREVGKLFSSMFLHVDIFHLIFNLLFLYLSAPFVEDLWGKPIFALFYISVGMAASLMQSVHYPHSAIPLVGASGAIAGSMGAFLVKFWNTKIKFAYYFSIWWRGTFNAPAWLMLPLWLGSEVFSAAMMDSANRFGPAQGGGVAHWVHIWGFTFGFIFAMLMSMFKVAEKFVEPKIKKETTYVNESYAAYQEAVAVLDAGGKDEAYTMLAVAARKDPYFSDTIEMMWNLGLDIGKKEDAAPYLERLMDVQIKRGNLVPALSYYKNLSSNMHEPQLSINAKIVLLQQMVEQRDMEYAFEFSRPMFKEIDGNTAPGMLVIFCTSVGMIDRELLRSTAGDVLNMALERSDIPDPTKAELRSYIRIPSVGAGMESQLGQELIMPQFGLASPPQNTQAPVQPPPIPNQATVNQQPPPIPEAPAKPKKSMLAENYQSQAPQDQFDNFRGTVISMDDYAASGPLPGLAKSPDDPVVKPPPPQIQADPLERDIEEAMIFAPQKVLKPTPTLPIGVKDGRIAVNIENIGQKGLPLTKIKTMAVVKISPPAQKPFLLIDLFLDNPATHTAANPKNNVINIRSLRVTSKNFNPQKLIPNTKTPIDAFRVFTSGLLKLSGASTFPDQESVLLKKMASYTSVQEYEAALLG